MRPLLAIVLALSLSGCGLYRSEQARDPHGSIIGMSLRDLIGCAGKPDSTMRTSAGTAVAQWNYASTSNAFEATVTLLGSVKIGNAGTCKMVATVLRSGTVAGVAFPGSQVTLGGGPYAGCNILVSECLLHPSDTGSPAGYDAWAYLFPEDGTK